MAIGFIQALGLTCYVAVVVSGIDLMSRMQFPDNKILAPMTFLLLFVLSALISGAIMLGYPLTLFLDRERKKALCVIAWSAAWLLCFLVLVGSIAVGMQWQ
jgi:hypothetical protein